MLFYNVHEYSTKHELTGNVSLQFEELTAFFDVRRSLGAAYSQIYYSSLQNGDWVNHLLVRKHLHATEEIAWAYEDKNPSGIKYFFLQVIHADTSD